MYHIAWDQEHVCFQSGWEDFRITSDSQDMFLVPRNVVHTVCCHNLTDATMSVQLCAWDQEHVCFQSGWEDFRTTLLTSSSSL
jgi:hypothetical protein